MSDATDGVFVAFEHPRAVTELCHPRPGRHVGAARVHELADNLENTQEHHDRPAHRLRLERDGRMEID